jgi:hypothetical protein
MNLSWLSWEKTFFRDFGSSSGARGRRRRTAVKMIRQQAAGKQKKTPYFPDISREIYFRPDHVLLWEFS